MSLNEPPRRIDLPFSNSAFLIENFFSPSECQHLIDQSEKVGIFPSFEPCIKIKDMSLLKQSY